MALLFIYLLSSLKSWLEKREYEKHSQPPWMLFSLCCGECNAVIHFQGFDLVINSLFFSCNPEPTIYPTYTTVRKIISYAFRSAFVCSQAMSTTGWLQLQPHYTGLPLLCSQNGEVQTSTKHGFSQLSYPHLALWGLWEIPEMVAMSVGQHLLWAIHGAENLLVLCAC